VGVGGSIGSGVIDSVWPIVGAGTVGATAAEPEQANRLALNRSSPGEKSLFIDGLRLVKSRGA